MMTLSPWCYPEDKYNDKDDVYTYYIHSVYID